MARTVVLSLALFFLMSYISAGDVSVSSIPWHELSSSLTSPSALKVNTNVEQLWLEQCVPIFEQEKFPIFTPLKNGSNYQLFGQENGLCSDILSCAWKYCDWAPTSSAQLEETVPFPSNYNYFFNPGFVTEEQWNLPAATIHPISVVDIIQSIQFAKSHRAVVGLSVKVSGHNYVGASTDKDSLSINMRKYPKYALGDTENSLLECNTITISQQPSDDNLLSTIDLRQKACQVAMSRNYSAILRVGGGEIWDEVYRSVSNWNKAQGQQRYHVLGGGAGTVGAAGGYLGGTGLSGTTGMRMFGFAADQVTQMEMVLPSGKHVRFGPTEWVSDNENLDWPRTTKVTGWCNVNPVVNESEWQWQECDDDNIDFGDLWHAVRGGGNGYGVTTAVEYQLHDYPGELSYLIMLLPDNFAEIAAAACGECTEAFALIATKWLNFLIDIYWNPAAVRVTEEDSIKCGGPDGGASLPIIFGELAIGFCYGNGGHVWSNAWKTQILSDSELRRALLNANATEEMIYMVYNALVPGVNVGVGPWVDYAAAALQNSPVPGVPVGRLPDSPKPFSTYNWAFDGTLVPIKFLVEQRNLSIPWLFQYAGAGAGMYVMGGRASRYHDGTAATSRHYREAGFLASITRGSEVGPELSRAMLRYHNGDGTPRASYPGGSEFNHYQAHFMGPLKTNWSEPCPALTTKTTRELRNEKCIPLMEYIFGSEGLKRLERIKAVIDPDHLFNCFGCIGYRESSDFSPSPTATLPPEITSGATFLWMSMATIVETMTTTLMYW